MTKCVLIIICFFSCFEVYPQSENYINPNEFRYYDHTISKKLMDSLKRNNVQDFLIYQTSMNYKFIKSQCIKDRNISITFFIWKGVTKAYAILITDTAIFVPKEISPAIFKVQFLKKIWLKKSDYMSEITSPAILPDYKKLALYYSRSISGFFEYGKNLFFKADPNLDKYKKEFTQMLDNELSKLNEKWEFYKSYNRYDEFLDPL